MTLPCDASWTITRFQILATCSWLRIHMEWPRHWPFTWSRQCLLLPPVPCSLSYFPQSLSYNPSLSIICSTLSTCKITEYHAFFNRSGDEGFGEIVSFICVEWAVHQTEERRSCQTADSQSGILRHGLFWFLIFCGQFKYFADTMCDESNAPLPTFNITPLLELEASSSYDVISESSIFTNPSNSSLSSQMSPFFLAIRTAFCDALGDVSSRLIVKWSQFICIFCTVEGFVFIFWHYYLVFIIILFV